MSRDEKCENRVLIVDDNELNTILLDTALKGMNLLSDIALDGKTAVEMASKIQYVLIVMDCQMPGFDGYEAAMAIRTLDRPYSEVPIVALSATFTKEKLNKCRAAGMNATIQKPIEIEELRYIVSQFVIVHKKPDMEPLSGFNNQKNSSQLEAAVKRLKEEMRFTEQQAYRLIMDYIDITAGFIIELENAYENKNYDKLVELSHKIKGVSSNLRLKELQMAAGEIERKSAEGDQNLLDDINKLKIFYSELRA